MQYLSQRLAVESTRTREDGPVRSPIAATQRERILASTEALMAAKGAAGTSIEAIVKAAGVSSVTFYEHFENKGACFVAVFDRAVELTRARIGARVPSELPWPEQIREGLRALLEAIDAEPERARICLVEAQMGGGELLARYDAVLDEVASKLREGRELSSAPAELSDTLEQATVGGLAWLLRQRLEQGEAEKVTGLLPKMIEIALSPYAGHAAGETPLAVASPVADDG